MSSSVWNNDITFNRNPNPFDLPNNIFCIVAGKTGCGKTTYIADLLSSGFLYHDTLTICTNTPKQPIYVEMSRAFSREKELLEDGEIDKEDLLFKELKIVEGLEKMTPISSLDRSKKNIIIFDDIMNERDQTIPQEYFTIGRHKNVDVFYLCQSFFKLPRMGLRDNANMLILFPPFPGSIAPMFVQYGSNLTMAEFKRWLYGCNNRYIPRIYVDFSDNQYRYGIENKNALAADCE